MASPVRAPRCAASTSYSAVAALACFGVLGASALAACGPAATQAQVIQLDPIEIKADRSGKTYVKDYDALVDEAMSRYHAGDHGEALRLFDALVREYPDRPGIAAVQHNAGLALLKLGRPADAAERFRDAMRRTAGSRNARDALFLLAEALDAAGKPLAAAAVLHGALEDPAVREAIGGDLGLLDGLEARAQLGLLYRRGGEITKADEAFRKVERLYNDHRDVQLVAESEWVARSLYERGEIYRELFAIIRFKLPVDRMKRDLEDKANLFLKAESAYFHCVRLQHKVWALAAGYEIGHLYTQLIEDIDNAEAPPELDALTVEVYRDELWNHTERLAKRAVVIYKKNIELATRLGQKDSDWVKRSEAGLSRMETLIESATARRVKLMTAPPPAGLPGVATPTSSR